MSLWRGVWARPDGHAAAAPAADADPPPATRARRPPPPQRRRLGVPDGVPQHFVRGAQIAFGRAQQLREQGEARVERLYAAVAPSIAVQTSKVMGPSKVTEQVASTRALIISGHVIEMLRRHKDKCDRPAEARAVVSHRHHQGLGLRTWLRRPMLGMFSTNILDDANLWVRKPNVAVDQHHTLLARRLEQKGPNVHLPVLNFVERLFAVSGTGTTEGSHAVKVDILEMQSPTQVLPSSNTSTIRSRWSAWSANTAGGSGSKLGGALVKAAVLQAPWRTIIVSKDNLIVNSCLVALEERDMKNINTAASHPDNHVSLLSNECAAHSAVLIQKSWMASADLPSKLVTMGHCLESGRVHTALVQGIHECLRGDGFVYREVDVLPPEAAVWRRENRRVLDLTHALRDSVALSENLQDLVLDADSGPWEDEVVLHLCLRGRCPLGCNGNAAVSRKRVGNVIALSIGGRCPVALIYRWKHFEEAAAFRYRGEKQHRLLSRALRTVYRKGDVEQAENDAARLQAAGQELQTNLKQKVRAGKVLKGFDDDPNAAQVGAALVMNRPVQMFLNAAFAAQAAKTKFEQAVLENPHCVESPASQSAAEAALLNAVKANSAFISGDRGKQVVQTFWSMIKDLEGAMWEGFSLSKDDRFGHAEKGLVAMAEAFRRLVWHYIRQPKYQVLLQGGKPFSSAEIKELCESLREQAVQCTECVDWSFTAIWIRRLEDARPWKVRAAHSTLRCMLGALPVATVEVEMKHLLGQELGVAAASRKRGRRPTAQTIQRRTYVQGVKKSHKRACDSVRDCVLGKDAKVRNAFGQLLRRNFELGRCASGKARSAEKERKAAKSHALKITNAAGGGYRRRRAFDEYVADAYEQAAGTTMAAKRARLNESWKTLPEDRIRHYQGLADAVNEQRREQAAS